MLFDKAKTTLLEAPGKLTGSYTIPSTVTTIGANAFNECYSMTSVTIPSGVTTIQGEACFECMFSSLTIPESATSIGYAAFVSCANPTSVTIPSGVSTISDQMFMSCIKLATITVEATTPPTFAGTITIGSSGNPFDTAVTGFAIKVPSAELSAYEAASGWSTLSSYLAEY